MRKVLVALVIALCAFFAPPAQAEQDQPIVVIGMTGLSWSFLNETDAPHLTRFANAGSVAAMSVKTVGPTTCIPAGWLTLGSGERVGSCEESAISNGRVGSWPAYEADAESNPYSPTLGRLGDGRTVVALGKNAVLGAASSAGVATEISSLGDGVGADVILIDLGSIGPQTGEAGSSAISGGDPLSSFFGSEPVDTAAIAHDLRSLDDRFATLLTDIQSTYGNPLIFVASVADYSSSTTGLQVLMSNKPGVISSLTTRTPGLVHLTDLTATLLSSSQGLEGSPLSWGSGSQSVGDMRQVSEHVDAVRPAVGPVMATWAAIWFAALIFAWRGKPSRFLLLSLGAVPAASIGANLLPWYTSSHSTLILLGLTAVLSAALGFIATQIGGVITVTGTNLVLIGLSMFAPQAALYTIIGSLPHTGRYYGMNNVLFAITAVNAIVLILALFSFHRRRAITLSATLAFLVVLVDGLPGFGTDFGGPPVLVIGLGVLILGLAGTWSWKRSLILVAAAVATSAGFVILDMFRDHPTHIGAFGQAMGDGTAWGIVSRKAGAVLAQWPFLIALGLLVAAAWWAWRRWGSSVKDVAGRHPDLAWAGIAALIILGGGSLINDSGIAILAMGIAAGLPLVVAYRLSRR